MNTLQLVEKNTLAGEPFRAFLEPLSKDLAATVREESKAFLMARAQTANGQLEMGKHLGRLREVLEPEKLWKRYINLFPNFTQASAYRYIWAWENAQRVLPPAVLTVATAGGYKLIDSRKGGRFAGKYGEAWRRAEKKLGPAPAEDTGKARVFLDAVLAEKRKLAVQVRRVKMPRWSESRGRELAERVTLTFEHCYRQVPAKSRASWCDEVIAQIRAAAKPVLAA